MFEQTFINLDPGQVKSEYRRLAFKYHPDRNASADFDKFNRIMQDLNETYHNALKRLDGVKFTGSDDRDHTYKYSRKTEDGVVDAVARTIRANLPERATVSIVGIYVWVEGLTRNDKAIHNVLKALGEENEDGRKPSDAFRYHSKRKAWYWKPSGYRSRYNKSATLRDIKRYYGARVIHKEDREQTLVPA